MRFVNCSPYLWPSTHKVYGYYNCMENLEPEFPVTSSDGSDGDASDNCAHIGVNVVGSSNYVWPKKEPELTAVSGGGGDGGAGDYRTLNIDIDGCYDPPKEEPEPELAGGDGNDVDIDVHDIPIATTVDDYDDCSISKAELKSELGTTDGSEDCYKEEPELVAMSNDTAADGCRDVGYDCSHCGVSLCTQEFKAEHELRCKILMKQKELESQITKLYHCGHCRCPFINKEFKEQHQQRHCLKRPVAKKKRSNGTHFECDKCKFVAKRKAQLVTHVLTHNKNKAGWFACTQCSHKTVRKGDMNMHMKIHNNTFSICCPICGKSFRRKFCLDDHLVRQHSDEPDEVSRLITCKIYTCDICDQFKTIRKTDFNKHVTLTHCKGVGCQKYECAHCPYSTFSKDCLANHKKRHGGQKGFQCAACMKQFIRKQQLDSHILYIHADNVDLIKSITSKLHHCKSCSFKTVDVSKIKSHVRSKHI